MKKKKMRQEEKAEKEIRAHTREIKKVLKNLRDQEAKKLLVCRAVYELVKTINPRIEEQNHEDPTYIL